MKNKIYFILLLILSSLHVYLYINFSSKTFVLIALALVLMCFLGLFFNNLFFQKIINSISPFVIFMGIGMAFYGISKMIARPKNQTVFNDPSAVYFEKTDFKTALSKAKASKKLIFVDFYTTWCGPCVAFKKTILADKEVAKVLNEKYINLAIDCEKGEGTEIANQYSIKFYPTLLLIDSEGNIIKKLSENESPSKQAFIESLN